MTIASRRSSAAALRMLGWGSACAVLFLAMLLPVSEIPRLSEAFRYCTKIDICGDGVEWFVGPTAEV